VSQVSEFTELFYVKGQERSEQPGLPFSGLRIMARRGKVVAADAWSCTWYHKFFDTLSEEDWHACAKAWEEHWNAKQRQHDLAKE
jgi:hypothetical protein